MDKSLRVNVWEHGWEVARRRSLFSTQSPIMYARWTDRNEVLEDIYFGITPLT